MDAGLMDIPVEILLRILVYCHPRDVSAFSQLCRGAYNLIYQPTDQYLWLQLYLAYPLDHPKTIRRRRLDANVTFKPDAEDSGVASTNKHRLINIIKAERAATTSPRTLEEERDAVNTFKAILEELPVYSHADDDEANMSYNAQWLDKTLETSLLLITHIIETPDQAEVERTKARLRACLRSTFPSRENITMTDVIQKVSTFERNKSRCFVYDLRNYTAETRYGPFTSDNRVNWRHAEHLMNVVWSNLCEIPITHLLVPPLGIEASRPHSVTGNYSGEDWAGIEGTWSRYICFMDHRDLSRFNDSVKEDGALDGDIFEDSSFREATRLLEVKLKLVEPSTLNGLKFKFPKVSESNLHRPPLAFKGSSRGPHGVESMIKGCVYQEEDGSIRWRFVRESIYDNSPQWSSSGVQIGDVGSAIGVIGVWTTAEPVRAIDDPVGPFWLFKNGEEKATQVMDFN